MQIGDRFCVCVLNIIICGRLPAMIALTDIGAV